MRLYVCGQKAFGAMAVHAVADAGHTVVGVSSPPDSSRYDTTGGLMPDRTRLAAERRGIRWLPSGLLTAETIAALDVDLIIAAHSHDFIGRRTREASRLGAIGYHPSLLPLHRGRDAVRWALKMGDRVTGGSVYWLDQNVDGGPVAAQQHVFVSPDETVDSLWQDKLAPLGITLILRVLEQLSAGVIVAKPQDESLATWEPSWQRPPLFRPELPRLGAYPEGFHLGE